MNIHDCTSGWSDICHFIKAAGVVHPQFLDDVMVSKALCTLLLCYSGQHSCDLLPFVLVRPVVCCVHYSIEELQEMCAVLCVCVCEEREYTCKYTSTMTCYSTCVDLHLHVHVHVHV